jgi:hypothetical protein
MHLARWSYNGLLVRQLHCALGVGFVGSVFVIKAAIASKRYLTEDLRHMPSMLGARDT